MIEPRHQPWPYTYTTALTSLGLSRQVLTKFFRKFALGEKSKYIDDDGNVIKMPGAQYEDNGVAKQY